MVVRSIARCLKPILKGLDYLVPLVDLVVRCWIAWIFFKAGLVKIEDWHSTVLLFANENIPYHFYRLWQLPC